MTDPSAASGGAVRSGAESLSEALDRAGRDGEFREALFDALRRAQARADDPADFRRAVRWPLIAGALEARTHRVALENGLVFEVGAESRIEESLLLSLDRLPDHVWEPQTTRLLCRLCASSANAIVGGAYIGDQAVPMARAMADRVPASPGVVHAFEPAASAFDRLTANVRLNGLTNVVPRRQGLWDSGGQQLAVEGEPALGSAVPVADRPPGRGEQVEGVSVDGYVEAEALRGVGVVMLDLEGGEERALAGAVGLLALPSTQAPQVIFEVHRDYVDWTGGLGRTPIVRLLAEHGYTLFAVRDVHGNHRMHNRAIEVIPVESVYLEGPPHGFNVLATKETDPTRELGVSVVEGVSPKLLRDKDPALFHPLDGQGL